MPELLLELRSEEIPARMQARARADLKARVTGGLIEAGLTYAAAEAFSTPRRLALAVDGMTGQSAPRREERKGPRTDAPEKAVEGFLRATGLTRDRLEVRADRKGEAYFATVEHPGRPADAIVAEVVAAVIRDFPWPKSMRWGAGTLRWVRPLHAILCIIAEEDTARVVDLELDGIRAGDSTAGHPFMAPAPFPVRSVEDYAAKLRAAKVILDSNERAEHIRHEAETAAFARGLELVADEGLLEEVAGLVEWPVVLTGGIGSDFLDLPPEVLRASMRENQKFFSLRNPKSGQIEQFVTVADKETEDAGATILAGNQRVLAARLADAKFFWENDLRVVRERGLEGLGAGLSEVTFHRRLGSQADRVARMATLAREIAPLVGADPEVAEQAARVCKADLESEMVGEFPELQGIMGRYYAREPGLDPAVAAACEMHYKPLGPNDEVPSEPVSVAVALADKLDTLTGFWAIDEKPTGSKDPFALRRAALGVIRIVLKKPIRISLSDHDFLRKFIARHIFTETQAIELIVQMLDGLKTMEGLPKYEPPRSYLEVLELADKMSSIAIGSSAREQAEEALTLSETLGSSKANDLLAFLHDRLKIHLRDRGIRHDVIDACLAMPGNDDLTLLVKRAEALAEVLKTDDGENLIQGFKRANNILTQAEEADGVEYSFGPDSTHAQNAEETALFAALDAADKRIAPALEAEDFATAMAAMAGLRAPIDAFFEAVQVNTDNQIVRRNRLNLLNRIRATCLSVADLTRIEG